MTIADQLRKRIEASGLTLTELGRQAGVPQPMLTRFMQGFDLRLATTQKLADYFGLELKPAKKAGNKR